MGLGKTKQRCSDVLGLFRRCEVTAVGDDGVIDVDTACVAQPFDVVGDGASFPIAA